MGGSGEKSLGGNGVSLGVRGGPQNTAGGFPAELCVAAEYYVLVANTAVSLGTDTPLASAVRTLACLKSREKRSLDNVEFGSAAFHCMCFLMLTDNRSVLSEVLMCLKKSIVSSPSCGVSNF